MSKIDGIFNEIHNLRKENQADHSEIKQRLVKLETIQDDCVIRQREKRGFFYKVFGGIVLFVVGWIAGR
jgi:hypothetical protein